MTEIMTKAESLQLAATILLALRLRDRGIQCAIHFPLAESPILRVDGLDMVEITALSDGRYEVWRTDQPLDPAPLFFEQSLDETVLFLSGHGGRA